MTASTERRSPLHAHSALLAQASGDPSRFAMGERAFVAQLNLRGDPTPQGWTTLTFAH